MQTFKQYISENVKLSKLVYDNLYSLEVDTFDGSNKPKEKFVKSLENAKKSGASYVIPSDDYTKEWLLKALDNAIDIADDNGNKRLINNLRKLETQVKSL